MLLQENLKINVATITLWTTKFPSLQTSKKKMLPLKQEQISAILELEHQI